MNTAGGRGKWVIWMYWLVVIGGLAAYLAYALRSGNATVYLVGDMTHAHHQIELACDSCHTEPFGGGEVLQTACMNCHAQDLKAGDDSHPKSKFTDPRNAERVARLDARYCVTCHMEHRPEITRPMGVTLPDDFCVECHADIASDRASHADLDFASCASAGCHNFHDNRGLYEDFLIKHQNEPDLHAVALRPTAPADALRRALTRQDSSPLSLQHADIPAATQVDQRIAYDWETSAHAQAGVNCGDCHNVDLQDGAGRVWLEKPDQRACQQCHGAEVEGFLEGMHGMRIAAGLAPMRPRDALIPMTQEKTDAELSCTSCHGAHRFDRAHAASAACLGCHADEHTLNYTGSPHAELWRREQAGLAEAGTGVSCATCHLPPELHTVNGIEVTLAQHNQNANLRPNEKMLRSVCMNCHGLAFAIDALADEALVKMNFSGRPARHIPSIDWAARRHTAESESGFSTPQEESK